jgi:hypothetical protein
MFCDTCGFIECICKIQREHHKLCRLVVAARCPVSIECEHGHDVCPICDPCNCSDLTRIETDGLPPLSEQALMEEP